MDWLNYHHFLYFWVVATEGTIVKAGEKLRLAHPTISAQIHRLEESLGTKLFTRSGRRLVLTESGQIAFRYAEEIFSLGRDFVDTIQGHASDKPLHLVAGISDALNSSLVRRFLQPAFALNHNIEIICRSDKSVEEFLTELALHRIDLVFSDRPVLPGLGVKAYSHLLGACDTSFFAVADMAKKLRRKFPDSLEGAPFIMPGAQSALRSVLADWFTTIGVRAKIIAECDDAALGKDFGSMGMGVFVAPSVIEGEVQRQYGVKVVGRSSDVRQQFYAISVEKKIRHPAVSAICDAARNEVFNPGAVSAKSRKSTERPSRGATARAKPAKKRRQPQVD